MDINIKDIRNLTERMSDTYYSMISGRIETDKEVIQGVTNVVKDLERLARKEDATIEDLLEIAEVYGPHNISSYLRKQYSYIKEELNIVEGRIAIVKGLENADKHTELIKCSEDKVDRLNGEIKQIREFVSLFDDIEPTKNKKDMKTIKIDSNFFHDDDACFRVAIKASTTLDRVQHELKFAKRCGDSDIYISKLEAKVEVLQELFASKECEKYLICE